VHKILIACGNVDILRKIVSDLPEGEFKPIATRSGGGIVEKVKGRGVRYAVIHENLSDIHGTKLAAALKATGESIEILMLVTRSVPDDGPFDHAIKYPVPGPIFRNALKRITEAGPREEDREQWRGFYNEVNKRLEGIESESYYRMFGVKQSAPHHIIVKIYDSLSYRYHPDRYQQYRKEKWGEAVFDAVNRLFKAYTEAFEVLTDRRLRKKYDEVLASGELRLSPDEASKKDTGPRHLNEFARQPTTKKFLNLAQSDIARRDWQQALQNLKFAQSMEPDNDAIEAKIAEIESKLS